MTYEVGDRVKVSGTTRYTFKINPIIGREAINEELARRAKDPEPYLASGTVTKVGDGYIWVKIYKKPWKFLLQKNGQYEKHQGDCPRWDLVVTAATPLDYPEENGLIKITNEVE